MALRIHSLHRDTDASDFPSPRPGRARSASQPLSSPGDVGQRVADVGTLWSHAESLSLGRSEAEPGADPPTLWCVDARVTRGTNAYLMLSGQAPSVVARGEVVRSSFLGPRWDRVGTVGLHIAVEWTQVLDPAHGLPIDQLAPGFASGPGEGEAEWVWELPARLRELLARDWDSWYAANQHRRHRAHRVPRLPEWRHRPPPPLPQVLIQDRAPIRGLDPSLGREIALILG